MTDMFSSINAASGVQAETTSITQKKKGETMDQEQFLKLFVTQLQNQDPMNPQDATEMSSQLAQYSQLEQMTNLNKGMDTLVEAYQHSDKLASLSTIGREAAYTGDSIAYSGEPVSIGYRLDSGAAEVSVTIKKDNAVVATIKGEELAKGDHYLTWDGTNNNGEPLPAGNYTFSVQAIGSDNKVAQLTTLVRNEVTGVDLSGDNGGTIKTTGGEIDFNSILGIFDKTNPASSFNENLTKSTAAGKEKNG